MAPSMSYILHRSTSRGHPHYTQQNKSTERFFVKHCQPVYFSLPVLLSHLAQVAQSLRVSSISSSNSILYGSFACSQVLLQVLLALLACAERLHTCQQPATRTTSFAPVKLHPGR